MYLSRIRIYSYIAILAVKVTSYVLAKKCGTIEKILSFLLPNVSDILHMARDLRKYVCYTFKKPPSAKMIKDSFT